MLSKGIGSYFKSGGSRFSGYRRDYHYGALTGGSVVTKGDPDGDHPVVVRKKYDKDKCDEKKCSPEDPQCGQISETVAVGNLTHSQSVNGIPTQKVSDTDIKGNSQPQFFHAFKRAEKVISGQGVKDLNADNMLQKSEVSNEVDKHIPKSKT